MGTSGKKEKEQDASQSKRGGDYWSREYHGGELSGSCAVHMWRRSERDGIAFSLGRGLTRPRQRKKNSPFARGTEN